MNPKSGETPQFQFPEVNVGNEQNREKAMEAQASAESAVTKKAPPMAPVATQAGATAPVAVDNTITSSSSQSQTALDDSLTAADIDRIEKEWVDRAKHIVAATKDDPYKQNLQMNKVKADYIKKRFNKTIPADGAA
jgi:hypothetical protein